MVSLVNNAVGLDVGMAAMNPHVGWCPVASRKTGSAGPAARTPSSVGCELNMNGWCWELVVAHSDE